MLARSQLDEPEFLAYNDAASFPLHDEARDARGAHNVLAVHDARDVHNGVQARDAEDTIQFDDDAFHDVDALAHDAPGALDAHDVQEYDDVPGKNDDAEALHDDDDTHAA